MRLKIEPCNTLPTEIKLHQLSRILEVGFDNGEAFSLPCEYLRVYTPSAEALGHGPGQETLQVGKENVTINEIKPIGNYASSPSLVMVMARAFTAGISCTNSARSTRPYGQIICIDWNWLGNNAN